MQRFTRLWHVAGPILAGLAALVFASFTCHAAPGGAGVSDTTSQGDPVTAQADASATEPALVVVVPIHGIIGPAAADLLSRGLEHAAGQGASLVVVELDTPGGLDTSMRAMVQAILASDVPVATWVGPGGARAASAGTFLLYASHIAAMAPASNLGAASPVAIGGAPQGRREPGTSGAARRPDADADNTGDARDESRDREGSEPARDVLGLKATNDAAAYIRSLAQLRGRNAEFAEQAVRDAISLPARDALEQDVIDWIAPDIPTLLREVDGTSVQLDTGDVRRLEVSQATLERLEPDWRHRVLAILTNPQVALVLMMIGVYGLFFELTSPGFALPGVAGVICLVLGLYAFHLLPVNWAGVALLLAGAAMMIAEVFVPSFGALGVGGIIAFVLGGMLMTDTGLPDFDLSTPFLIGVGGASAVILALAGSMIRRAYRAKVVSGREALPGQTGTVIALTQGIAYAEVQGERWRVRADQPLTVGDTVRVTGVTGLVLQVERVAQTDGTFS